MPPIADTGTQLSINQIQEYYGYPTQSFRSLSALANREIGTNVPPGPISISAGFGGKE